MKQRIIFISGHIGAGKTVTGELLHERLDNCARVEPDFLILIKPFETGEKIHNLRNKNTISVVSNFLEDGYQNILIVGGIWSQADLDTFAQHFSTNKYDIYVFWLHMEREARHARALKRGDLGDNVEWLEKRDKDLPYPSFPLEVTGGKFYQVEMEDKSPEQVRDEILGHLGQL